MDTLIVPQDVINPRECSMYAGKQLLFWLLHMGS